MVTKRVGYYIAANRYEGCRHRHRTTKAAERCLPKIDTTRGPVRVLRVK